MRRLTKGHPRKLSADSERLIAFADAIMQSSSRIEERRWEGRIDSVLQKLLKTSSQDSIDQALDQCFKIQSAVYDVLMEAVEANAESLQLTHDGVTYDALLIAAPILAWTRFSIASGPISSDMLATLSAHLYAHVLAPDVRMAMAPTLFSIDQLPPSHAATLALTQQLAQAALKGSAMRAPAKTPETAPFLADTRFLLAAIVAPTGQPMFGWEVSQLASTRETALAQWKAQAQPNLARLMPGCGLELILPEAYFVACRAADKLIRPTSIHAAVHFLTHALDVAPPALQAIIGGFGEDTTLDQIDEYRIGFALESNQEVLYGVVWTLFGQEEAADAEQESDISAPSPRLLEKDVLPPVVSPMEEILTTLREAGITHIKRHPGCFAMESCDDCGAPFFLDIEGELVHAEMPEELPQGPAHFH